MNKSEIDKLFDQFWENALKYSSKLKIRTIKNKLKKKIIIIKKNKYKKFKKIKKIKKKKKHQNKIQM